jgi:NitT/TauT family transport system substrate-binding protein
MRGLRGPPIRRSAMKRSRIYAVVAIVVTVAVAAFVVLWLGPRKGRAADQLIPVRVAYKANAGYQHFFVAYEKGYFKELGLNVTLDKEFESTNQMLEALVANRVDVTSGSSTEVLGMVWQNSPDIFRVFLTSIWHEKNPFEFLIVPTDSPITTLQELQGKKISSIPGSTPVTWLEMVLEQYFDPETEVEIIETSPRLQLQALAAKQVDAVYTVEPVVTIGRLKGISRTLHAGPIHEVFPGVLPAGMSAVSTSFLEQEPEAAANVMRALYRAVDFIRENPEETKAIVAKYTKLDAKVASQLKTFEYWKLSEMDVGRIQNYVDVLSEKGILTKRVKVQEMVLSGPIAEGL